MQSIFHHNTMRSRKVFLLCRAFLTASFFGFFYYSTLIAIYSDFLKFSNLIQMWNNCLMFSSSVTSWVVLYRTASMALSWLKTVAGGCLQLIFKVLISLIILEPMLICMFITNPLAKCLVVIASRLCCFTSHFELLE